MISGIGVTCFAASYAVAFGLEVTRLLFRSGARGAIMRGFAVAGLVAHTGFLYSRVRGATAPALSSEQDWYLVAAWLLASAYLYLSCNYPKKAFGVFVLPLVLVLVGMGAYMASPEPFARGDASRLWGVVHAGSILLATVSVFLGSSAGLMYLGQVHRLRHKLPPRRGLRLPSLEWLQRANRRALVIAMLTLGVGALSGIVLNSIGHAGRVPWYDPVVLSTLIMFGWLAACSGIGLLSGPAREGRRVACLTVLSFLFLIVSLSVGLLASTQHGGPKGQEGIRKAGEGRFDGPVSRVRGSERERGTFTALGPRSEACSAPTRRRLPPDTATCTLPFACCLRQTTRGGST